MKGKPRNTVRPARLEISIPEDIKLALDLHLYSHVEKRVPHGAHKRLICELLREYLHKANHSGGQT